MLESLSMLYQYLLNYLTWILVQQCYSIKSSTKIEKEKNTFIFQTVNNTQLNRAVIHPKATYLSVITDT